MRIVAVSIVFVLLSLGISPATSAQLTCDSFNNQALAQVMLNESTADALDPDGDGIACESLPEAGNRAASGQQSNPTSVSAPNGADDDPTDQEEAYLDALNEQTETVGDVSSDLSTLFTDAGTDPTLFLDQRWIIDVAAQFATLQLLEDEAQALQPSERQQGIHDVWIEITRLLTLAVDDYTFGIDNLEPASLEQGTGRFVWATTLTEDLEGALEAFDDNPNIAFEPTYPLFPVETCDQFSDFNVAQEYYAANPEDQVTVDPDLDGLACEVFFEEE